jgi:hypothetical protein
MHVGVTTVMLGYMGRGAVVHYNAFRKYAFKLYALGESAKDLEGTYVVILCTFISIVQFSHSHSSLLDLSSSAPWD